MFNISDLKNAKALASANRAEKLEEYDDLVKEGFALFEKGIRIASSQTLKDAAKKFVKSLACRRDKVEPYAYLASIFYLFDEEETCRDFYEKAKSLNPDFAELKKLKKFLN
jgi:hypothetical protein